MQYTTQKVDTQADLFESAFVKLYEMTCEKGHYLTWVCSFVKECHKCKTLFDKNANCRWMCKTCQVKYCVNCYGPPTCGTKCPRGHDIEIKNLTHNVCDNCSKTIQGDAYRDKVCDFDLCKNCFQDRED